MKCHQCNQDSIKIDNGHICCDICGLDINISLNLEEDHFFDLFFYNKNLGEAEKLGMEACEEGIKRNHNPYTTNSDQLALNRSWERGWDNENMGYELEGLLFSAEKTKEILKNKNNTITELIEDKTKYHGLYKELVEQLYLLSSQKYLLGKTYKKKLEEIKREIPDK